jgi:hypothetical protein
MIVRFSVGELITARQQSTSRQSTCEEAVDLGVTVISRPDASARTDVRLRADRVVGRTLVDRLATLTMRSCTCSLT